MASRNTPATAVLERTYEGASVFPSPTPIKTLRRLALTCLLWEPTFYAKGDTIAAEMATLVSQCSPFDVVTLAKEVRESGLRHVPLFLIRELARIKGNGPLVEEALVAVIQRPDEITEYATLYWAEKRQPLSNASKRALRRAFAKFTPYQIAKYQDATKTVKLRDILRLVRPKPMSGEQAETWKALRAGTLAAPDTWETALSAGADKKATFERLIREKKLGGLATLRNLRNMQESGVDKNLIRERLAAPLGRVWPYQFITASKFAPTLEPELETAMLRGLAEWPKLPGRTRLLVDVSGSMLDKMSTRPEGRVVPESPTRMDVAASLAILLREVCEDVEIVTFSDNVVGIPTRRGFALRDAIAQSQRHSGTYLRGALDLLQRQADSWKTADRVIVITDEQSADGIAPAWSPKAYVINVAPYRTGVTERNGWTSISGWSDRVVDYIQEVEQS